MVWQQNDRLPADMEYELGGWAGNASSGIVLRADLDPDCRPGQPTFYTLTLVVGDGWQLPLPARIEAEVERGYYMFTYPDSGSTTCNLDDVLSDYARHVVQEAIINHLRSSLFATDQTPTGACASQKCRDWIGRAMRVPGWPDRAAA